MKRGSIRVAGVLAVGSAIALAIAIVIRFVAGPSLSQELVPLIRLTFIPVVVTMMLGGALCFANGRAGRFGAGVVAGSGAAAGGWLPVLLSANQNGGDTSTANALTAGVVLGAGALVLITISLARERDGRARAVELGAIGGVAALCVTVAVGLEQVRGAGSYLNDSALYTKASYTVGIVGAMLLVLILAASGSLAGRSGSLVGFAAASAGSIALVPLAHFPAGAFAPGFWIAFVALGVALLIGLILGILPERGGKFQMSSLGLVVGLVAFVALSAAASGYGLDEYGEPASVLAIFASAASSESRPLFDDKTSYVPPQSVTDTSSPAASDATPSSLGRIRPETVETTSVMAPVHSACMEAGATVAYSGENAFDEDPNTAWATLEHDGTGQSLTARFSSGATIQEVGIMPGYGKYGPARKNGCADGKHFLNNRLITSVRWEFEDGTSVEQTFTDEEKVQLTRLSGAKTTRSVRVVITGTRLPAIGPWGPPDDNTLISEIALYGTVG